MWNDISPDSERALARALDLAESHPPLLPASLEGERWARHRALLGIAFWLAEQSVSGEFFLADSALCGPLGVPNRKELWRIRKWGESEGHLILVRQGRRGTRRDPGVAPTYRIGQGIGRPAGAPSVPVELHDPEDLTMIQTILDADSPAAEPKKSEPEIESFDDALPEGWRTREVLAAWSRYGRIRRTWSRPVAEAVTSSLQRGLERAGVREEAQAAAVEKLLGLAIQSDWKSFVWLDRAAVEKYCGDLLDSAREEPMEDPYARARKYQDEEPIVFKPLGGPR
ncbi:MAG TPA: hypothetical protein VNB06_00690 [Thermoanaerobaculia bacterium]|nr:hypothetical protein [Thermoanaerobaculia bacterium]